MPTRDDPIAALLAAVRETTALAPVCAAQVTLARAGRILASAAYGSAPFGGRPQPVEPVGEGTLFSVYSVTKALVSAASWLLLQEHALSLSDRVAQRFPEFARHGKQGVTIEQLLTHSAGFPSARLSLEDAGDPERRLAAMAEWRLEWEPGSRFVYHGVSSMWVLAELIARASGVDYRDFVRTRIVEPLQLHGELFLGLPAAANPRVADVVMLGEPMTEEQRGAAPVDAPVVDADSIHWANSPAGRAAGSPGGGAIGTARALSLFYQALLADARGEGPGIWRADVLRDAWTVRGAEWLDPMTGQPAMRGLGVVMAGGVQRFWRGFPEACSPASFGHMGAGGQISWADPDSGLSLVYLTNGAQQNPTAQGAAGLRLSTLAAACADAA